MLTCVGVAVVSQMEIACGAGSDEVVRRYRTTSVTLLKNEYKKARTG